LFGRHVRRRAHDVPGFRERVDLLPVEEARKPEVEELNERSFGHAAGEVTHQEDVVRL
jgi:hypothetical protein